MINFSRKIGKGKQSIESYRIVSVQRDICRDGMLFNTQVAIHPSAYFGVVHSVCHIDVVSIISADVFFLLI
jgi:hypothetical protein